MELVATKCRLVRLVTQEGKSNLATFQNAMSFDYATEVRDL